MKIASAIAAFLSIIAAYELQQPQDEERPIVDPKDFHYALASPDVWEEIGVVDGQGRILYDLKRQFLIDKENYREIHGVSNEEAMRVVMQSFESQLVDVLLPHQLRRLSQLGNQLRVEGEASSFGLESELVANELGLSDNQREELHEIVEMRERELEELTARLQAEFREFNAESLEKFQAVLSMEQREKYQELLGHPSGRFQRSMTLRLTPF